MSGVSRAEQKIAELQREADWQRSIEISSPRPGPRRAARRKAEEIERQIRSLQIWVTNIKEPRP